MVITSPSAFPQFVFLSLPLLFFFFLTLEINLWNFQKIIKDFTYSYFNRDLEWRQTKYMCSVCLFKTKQNKTRIPLLFFLVSYCLLSWTLLFCSFQIPDQLLSLAYFASPLQWSDCLRGPIAAPSGAISSVCVWTPKKRWVLFLSFRVPGSHDPEMASKWVACFHISKHYISLIFKVFSVPCLGLPEQ